MKYIRTISVVSLCVLTLLSMGAVSYVIASRYLVTSKDTMAQCTDSRDHMHLQVAIRDDAVVPEHSTGTLCDTMTITNYDSIIRLIAFGPHENHQPYDNIAEQVLGHNQAFTITFIQAGNFRFHDHLHDWVTGTFTVNR